MKCFYSNIIDRSAPYTIVAFFKLASFIGITLNKTTVLKEIPALVLGSG